MRASTAKFIAYNLRASKQAERRILIDLLKCANEAGVNISDCRYVGMGGSLFYDFHLIHRFLGVRQMISLEHDEEMYARSVFNCPYDFIKVRNETVAEFIESDVDGTRTIYWLDYDGGISPDIAADIISLGTHLQLGGFAFVTVYAEPPRSLEKTANEARLDYFFEALGEFSVGLTRDDMGNAAFPKTIHRVLIAAFKNAFAVRRDGVFRPLLQVQYKDSSTMVTVGGCFCEASSCDIVENRMKKDLPFLLDKNPPYKIKNLNLTERERALFDMAVTRSSSRSRQANKLRALGFKDGDFKAYKELIRFYLVITKVLFDLLVSHSSGTFATPSFSRGA
jgi:hypothetical protein